MLTLLALLAESFVYNYWKIVLMFPIGFSISNKSGHAYFSFLGFDAYHANYTNAYETRMGNNLIKPNAHNATK
jgi:hypothetical protein